MSFFLPNKIEVRNSIKLTAEKKLVYNQIVNLKTWHNWFYWEPVSPELLIDSSIVLEDNIKWKTNNTLMGNGKIQLIKTVPHDSIVFTITINDEHFENIITLAQNNEETFVYWEARKQYAAYQIIKKYFSSSLKKNMQLNVMNTLNELKKYINSLPKIQETKVLETVITENKFYLSIRDTVNPNEMENLHGKSYATIQQFMDSNFIKIAGAPLAIYHFWSDTLIDIELGIPVADSTIKGNAKVQLHKINKGKVITALHIGPYERLPETYFSINEWIKKNNKYPIGPPWEVYITDPANEPNPEKWKTAVFFPIK
jgi:AraC family transcriptional regulator